MNEPSQKSIIQGICDQVVEEISKEKAARCGRYLYFSIRGKASETKKFASWLESITKTFDEVSEEPMTIAEACAAIFTNSILRQTIAVWPNLYVKINPSCIRNSLALQ